MTPTDQNSGNVTPPDDSGNRNEPKHGFLSDLRSRMGVLGELFAFLWKVRLWWLIPMAIMLVIFFFIFVLLPATPLAPFIYSLH